MKLILLLCSVFGLFAMPVQWPANPETATLSGHVYDDNKEALIYATVKVYRDSVLVKAAQTDFEGKYTIRLEPGKYHIEAAFTGFEKVRFENNQINPGENLMDFILQTNTQLAEVVVSAPAERSIQRKAVVTKSDIKTISTKETSTGKSTKSKNNRKKEAKAPVLGEADKTSTPPKPTTPAPAKAPAEAPRDVLTDPGTARPDVATELSEMILDDAKASMEDEVAPVDGPGVPPAPRAGLLTAGEWNDLYNWNHHWLPMLNDGELDSYQKMYLFYPKYRYTVLLSNDQDFPLSDTYVKLTGPSGELIWQTRTDNTGKAELWAGLFDDKNPGALQLSVLVGAEEKVLGTPKPAVDGMNRYRIETPCVAQKNVDIMWAVDATGSMGDEIEYLKTELLDVINRAKGQNPELAFRMGAVFYRDKGDEYLTKNTAFSSDINETMQFIRKQYAAGGGDYPEAVHSALEEAIFKQSWSPKAIARICFLLLDASPHNTPEVKASLQRSIREAARLGIRIVPITASGIQKDTEFLMKFFGLATNGTYVFLTDHSGVGGKHLEPTSDEYTVEPLNQLLVRLINEYTTLKSCEGQSAIRFEVPENQQNQTTIEARYFPNPAVNQFTLELPVEVQSVTLYNSEGKMARKIENLGAGQHSIQVNDLPEGFYTMRIMKDGLFQSGKLMVIR